MPRRLTTTYSGRIAAATPSPSGPSLTVTVNPAQSPTPVDPRGYPLPRRHLVCAAVRILRSPASPSPLLDLADYLSSHRLTLTADEASEVVKGAIPRPRPRARLLPLRWRLPPGADPSEAMRLIAEMERDGVAGNISTVNLLIGMGVEVDQCLDRARKWGLRLNGYTYKCIVQAHLRSREVWKGFDVYEEMRRKGYRLDIFAYNMLLDALAKAGMV
ncbi:hypothetical protein PR202_ga06952 [Eleusine coracana subsp. coracana]|uniref:Pentatricopeptide repeat-containing protein n=1 Tax=Eleusine coracana subsp. coracana TaxID=191504 RepID=A0AAV5BWP3_ELECO|nr:hypothetical protein PR202_ga06952 [Eleusine coracana subsp. coracana]